MLHFWLPGVVHARHVLKPHGERIPFGKMIFVKRAHTRDPFCHRRWLSCYFFSSFLPNLKDPLAQCPEDFWGVGGVLKCSDLVVSLLCLPFRPSVQTCVALPSSHPCPPSEVQTACLSVVVPTSESRCRWVRLSARLFCVCAPFSNAPELGNWEVEFTLIFQAWRIGRRSQWMLTYTLSVTGTL